MLRAKPRPFSSRGDPPHSHLPHTAPASAHPAPRQTSFGKLMQLATRDRAVCQKYPTTHDDTVKTLGSRHMSSEYHPMVKTTETVQSDHPGPAYGRRTINPVPSPTDRVSPDHPSYLSLEDALPREGKYPLPSATRHHTQVQTRLTGPRADNFRKVSAPRTSFPANLAKPTFSAHPTRPLVPSKTGPAFMRFADMLERPGPITRQDSPIIKTSRSVQDRIAALAEVAQVDPTRIAAEAASIGHRVTEVRRQAPSGTPSRPTVRRYNTDEPARVTPNSRSSWSNSSADLNRPLPPIPKEDEETPTRRSETEAEHTPTRKGAIKRKSVPAFLANNMIDPSPLVIPEVLCGVTKEEQPNAGETPMSASQLIRNTLNWLDQSDKQREVSRSYQAPAPRDERAGPTGPRSYHNTMRSLTSSSTLSSMGIRTPPEQPMGDYFLSANSTDADEDIARKLQAMFNDLEDHQTLSDERFAAQLQLEEDTNGEVAHFVSQGQSKKATVNPPAAGVSHVHSIRAKIESANSPTQLSARVAPLQASTTGVPVFGRTASTPSPTALVPLGPLKRNTVPIGSTEAGQHFIPSGRSFDTVRQAAPAVSAALPIQANQGQADIEMLRKELRPVKTGDRVSDLVQSYESRKNSRPSSWYVESPTEAVVTPIRTLADILGREHLVRSSDLSMEGKRMMAEVRARRRQTHGVV